MRVRCHRCGKLASNQYPCKVCGNRFTMGSPGMTRIIEIEVPDTLGLAVIAASGHEVHLFSTETPSLPQVIMVINRPGEDSSSAVLAMTWDEWEQLTSATPHPINPTNPT